MKITEETLAYWRRYGASSHDALWMAGRIVSLESAVDVKELEKQNKQQCIDNLTSTLKQQKAEIERLTKWGEGWQKGCIEEQASNARLARERNTLRSRISMLTEQLEQANRHLNWLPPDQSFICSGCGVVYPNPHATDRPEVQQ